MALGSFLELVLDRVPRGESVLWPPSHCRTCSHRLTVDELIPVVSYLVQGGRCRNCDARIDSGMPLREGLSGAALALPWAIVGCTHSLASLGSGIGILAAIWIVRALIQARAGSVSGKGN